MPTLACFGVKPPEADYLARTFATAAPELTLVCDEAPLDATHLPARRDFELCSVFVDSALDRAVFAALPALTFVATRSTGYDHVDVAAARARGVVVSNVPSYGEHTVAEYAFALLLATSRRICVAAARVRAEGRFSYEGLQGFDLKGKTIGVVGTGRIGRHVVRIAQGFEMRVLAYDPRPDPALAVTYVSLDQLLAESDVVTLHVPYSPATHHLIGAAAFAKVKRGAVLINTSRGGVVDTPALALALQRGQLAGAGLDVLEEEGVIQDEISFLAHGHPEAHNLRAVLAAHALIDHPHVVVTPHNAFNTREALQRIVDTTVANVVAYLRGAPQNVVN